MGRHRNGLNLKVNLVKRIIHLLSSGVKPNPNLIGKAILSHHFYDFNIVEVLEITKNYII